MKTRKITIRIEAATLKALDLYIKAYKIRHGIKRTRSEVIRWCILTSIKLFKRV